MERKTFIYKITNTQNNKIYIGKTCNKNPLNRWASHLSIAKNKTIKNNTYQVLHKAINKYGKEKFTFEIIEKCDNEPFGLEREKFWIKHFCSFGKMGYNLTEGGDGSSGFKHSEETKDKMSVMRKGTRLGDENTFYGKHHSEETKDFLRSKFSGKKLPLSNIEKRSKLKLEDVLNIRSQTDNLSKKEKQIKYKEFSLKYGVSINMIRLIITRKRWNNI